MTRTSAIVILGVAFLAISSLAIWLQRPDELLAPDPDASWTIADVHRFAKPEGMGLLHSRSLDGRWFLGEFLGVDGEHRDEPLACFWEAASLVPSCPEQTIVYDASMRFSWAPDSSVVAISHTTESNAPILLVSPERGDVEHLHEAPDDAPETLFGRVTWSPDGERLAFAQRVDDERNLIQVLDRPDGSVREVVSSPGRVEFSVFDDLVWAGDDTLVFTGEDEDGFDGVWRIQVDGSTMTRLVTVYDPFVKPRIHDVSPDGRYLITDAPGEATWAEDEPDDDAPRYIVYDLEASEIVLELPRTYRNEGSTNLQLTLDADVEVTQEHPPLFLPDGNLLLLVSAESVDEETKDEFGPIELNVESGRLFVIDEIEGFPDEWQRSDVLADGSMTVWIDEDQQSLITFERVH